MTKTRMIFTLLLRLLALGATLAATIIMVTSHDSVEVLKYLTFQAKYSDETTFKYFVIAEAVASGYSLIVLFISSKSLLRHLVMILDVVITTLLSSSVSAALAIAHVGKKGNSHAGWLPICGQVHKFCNQVSAALIAAFIAAIIYLVLLLYTLHTVYM